MTLSVRSLVCGCLALTAITFSERLALAQSRSMFGGQGVVGSRLSNINTGFGSPMSGQTAFGSRSSGTMSLGQFGNFGGGFGGASALGGTSGFGGGLNGSGSFGGFGSSAFGTQGQRGYGSGQRGLIGRSDNVGRFIGSAQSGMQGSLNGSTAGTRGMGLRNTGARGMTRRQSGDFNSQDQAFGNGFQRQSGNGFGRTGANGIRRPIQPEHRVGFAFPATPAPTIQNRLAARYQQVAPQSSVRGVNVGFANGQVVLRGRVASDSDRRLAEQLARLEPGVRTVQNELTVGP
jgi:hypothetical protein